MCSYSDKNIEPNYEEKLRTWKNAEILNLRTTEPQKNLLVLIEK